MTDAVDEPPPGFLPITQDNVLQLFDLVYAPWIKDLGLTDFVVREGFVSARLPLNDRLKFTTGFVCGQALMSAIDTVASIAAATTPRNTKGTVYQHTHFLGPAVNDDFLVTAAVLRFGNASAYIECGVTFAGSGERVAHAVLEFAF